jgi:hypothetical protein
MSVGFPSIGNDLNESAAERSIGDVGDPVAIGFDIQFNLLILPQGALFEILYIDTGIFDGFGVVTRSDFDCQPSRNICLRRRLGRIGGRILGSDTECSGQEKGKEENSPFRAKKNHDSENSMIQT